MSHDCIFILTSPNHAYCNSDIFFHGLWDSSDKQKPLWYSCVVLVQHTWLDSRKTWNIFGNATTLYIPQSFDRDTPVWEFVCNIKREWLWTKAHPLHSWYISHHNTLQHSLKLKNHIMLCSTWGQFVTVEFFTFYTYYLQENDKISLNKWVAAILVFKVRIDFDLFSKT